VTTSRTFRGVSAEERRAVRRTQLIEALLDLVLQEGTARVTVDKVCAAAKLTKRYFYESFKDLDELMLAGADQVFDGLFLRMQRDVTQAPPERSERLLAAATAVVDELASDRRHARLYAEAPGHPLLRERRAKAIDAFTAYMTQELVQSAETHGQTMLQARIVVAGSTDLITGWLDGSIQTDRASVISAATTMAFGL